MMPPDVARIPTTAQSYHGRLAESAPFGSGHLHWQITAYQAEHEGALLDACEVSVEADDEEAAIARAMRIVRRNFYRVRSVTESCTLDPALGER